MWGHHIRVKAYRYGAGRCIKAVGRAAVEATDHAADRAILWVLRRTGNVGPQNAEGSALVKAMMTLVAMLTPQHCLILAYVTAVCEAAPGGNPTVTLLPTSDAH
jgi:hypothetical protein